MTKVFAISDLHLSCDDSKKMDVFGEKWTDHFDKIRNDWQQRVSEEDIVLLPGDLSWAMALDEAAPHIDAVCGLQGKKVILKGNHDYWWSSLTKVRNMLNNDTYVVQNDSVGIDEFIICGTRGWLMPDDQNFAEDKDRAIYERELLRLRMSLDSAKKKQQSGSRIIVMMHFPPLYPNRRKTGFSEIISEYGVNSVVYGHLHGDCYSQARYPMLEENGIPYYLVSCDTLDFRLREII